MTQRALAATCILTKIYGVENWEASCIGEWEKGEGTKKKGLRRFVRDELWAEIGSRQEVIKMNANETDTGVYVPCCSKDAHWIHYSPSKIKFPTKIKLMTSHCLERDAHKSFFYNRENLIEAFRKVLVKLKEIYQTWGESKKPEKPWLKNTRLRVLIDSCFSLLKMVKLRK